MADMTILKVGNNSYNIKDSVARNGLNDKISKVAGAVNGNLPTLTSSGLIVDSGKKPSDYYTKTETNTLLSGKANQSSVNTLSQNLEDLAGDVALLDTDVENLQTGKQDTLISGTNIKTVNGNSLLGSGNISITGAWSISVANEEIAFTSM